MAHDKIPVVVNITPEFYRDRAYFRTKLETMKRLFAVEEPADLLVLISYRYFKPDIGPVQVSNYQEAKRHFPNMAIVHAAGVKWNGHDAELRAMGIPIFEEGNNAGF